MGHYQSNLRDIEFNLFEVLRRQDLLGREPYADLDEQTVRGILAEMNRLAAGPLAESFADGVLPRLAAEREVAEQTSLDLTELPEAAF